MHFHVHINSSQYKVHIYIYNLYVLQNWRWCRIQRCRHRRRPPPPPPLLSTDIPIYSSAFRTTYLSNNSVCDVRFIQCVAIHCNRSFTVKSRVSSRNRAVRRYMRANERASRAHHLNFFFASCELWNLLGSVWNYLCVRKRLVDVV